MISVTDRGRVRTITLDRPESKNGLTHELALQIVGAITGGTPARSRTRPPASSVPASAANVFVLAGANGAFCSGLDLKDAMKRGLTPGPELRKMMSESFHGVIRALRTCGVPTIAAVDGVAAGFGCDLALACDLRIISERASFAELFVRRGLMPDGGSTFLLPRIIGLGRALEMFYTGAAVGPDEAIRIGLANKLYPSGELAAQVDALADRLAAGPPLAFEALKNAVYDGLDDASLSRALDREADGQMRLLASKDFDEGVTAFLQKRDPTFRGH